MPVACQHLSWWFQGAWDINNRPVRTMFMAMPAGCRKCACWEDGKGGSQTWLPQDALCAQFPGGLVPMQPQPAHHSSRRCQHCTCTTALSRSKYLQLSGAHWHAGNPTAPCTVTCEPPQQPWDADITNPWYLIEIPLPGVACAHDLALELLQLLHCPCSNAST